MKSFNNWLKKSFIGNYVAGLNSDAFRNSVASDATELLQLVENGIVWIYDDKKDIHYFYR